MPSDKCPWGQCDKPWSKHVGLEKVVHSEKADSRKCICPVLRPTPGGCPVHGG